MTSRLNLSIAILLVSLSDSRYVNVHAMTTLGSAIWYELVEYNSNHLSVLSPKVFSSNEDIHFGICASIRQVLKNG